MKLLLITVFILFWITVIHAETAESAESADGKSSSRTNKYRLSGILLMCNYDGLRVDIATMIKAIKDGATIGELVRKADIFFTNAEIKGKIAVELPNGETRTLLQLDDYSPVSFAEPIYFSVEYDGSSARRFNITCNMDEKDGLSSDDSVCKGSQMYQARKIVAREVDSFAASKQELSRITKETKNSEIVTLIVRVMHMFGYEKLYNTEGASSLKEIIQEFIELASELPGTGMIQMIEKLIGLLGDISGIFLIDMTVQKVTEGKGTYKRIDDSWAIVDNYENLDELYGQLYVLPEASILNIADVMEGMGLSLPGNMKTFMKDLEIPFVQGPAFPLFDLTRPRQKSTGFELQPYKKNLFSSYFRNTEDNKYIVFANLWEYDGDLAVTFDDCFVKGNALGLETIDFTSAESFQMSQCDNNAIHTTLYREKEITNDAETDLTDYELTGTFTLRCTSDAGNYYEPFGEFSLSIGHRSINQKFIIWKINEDDYVTVKNYQSYIQPFVIRFRESSSFLDTANEITLYGYVTESDSSSANDQIGNYDGEKIDSQTLSELRTFKYSGEEYNSVTITMKVEPVIGNHAVELVDYVLTGVFDFWTSDGAGSSYEPYGNFRIDMGNREDNLEYLVWESGKGDMDVPNYDHYSMTFTNEFQEISTFQDTDQTSSQIVLHGTVWEWDTGGNDVIGDYDGATYLPADLKEAQTYVFPGDGSDVTITLQVQKKSDIPVMVTYKVTGSLRMYCYGDSGKGYEPYGSLYIDLGGMTENQRFEAWWCSEGCGMYTLDSTWTVIEFEHEFEELDTFLDEDQSNTVTYHGKAWEDDNIGDDLLGDYDDQSYNASEFAQETTKTYPGDYYKDETQIVMKIEKVSETTKTSSRKITSGKKSASGSGNADMKIEL